MWKNYFHGKKLFVYLCIHNSLNTCSLYLSPFFLFLFFLNEFMMFPFSISIRGGILITTNKKHYGVPYGSEVEEYLDVLGCGDDQVECHMKHKFVYE